jgi:diketogulonate reductase-like aldo/keto reductase
VPHQCLAAGSFRLAAARMSAGNAVCGALSFAAVVCDRLFLIPSWPRVHTNCTAIVREHEGYCGCTSGALPADVVQSERRLLRATPPSPRLSGGAAVVYCATGKSAYTHSAIRMGGRKSNGRGEMKKHLLSRRQFSARCAALGLTPAVGAMLALQQGAPALAAATAPAGTPARTVKLPGGTTVSALGQGAWHLGQGRHPPAVEQQALLTGISLGMTLIDTSGNYGDGRSEQFLGHALAGQRERIFLVSKVEANEVSGDGIARACAASLTRLATDHLDLYLLHSPVPSRQFGGVVAAFEQLRGAGKIRAWGVSNFDRGQMEDLFRVPGGDRCATNQVAYSLRNRRIERDLLPWCTEHNMPVMAYSPLGGDNNLLVADRVLARLGAAHQCSAAAVALAWVIQSGKVIAIPESGSPAHTRENAAALSIELTPEDLQKLAAAFPGARGAT